MNIPLYRGATVVTMPRFDFAEFMRVLQDYRITRPWVVPPIVLAMAKRPLVDQYDLSSLEYMNSRAQRHCRPSSRWRAVSASDAACSRGMGSPRRAR
jgi:acyl-CoA synthetase (AMP-forming)/AMP-acid ligase II